MKKQIMTSLLLGAASVLALAEGYNIVINTADGERHVFDSEKVAEITFANAPKYTGVHEFISAQYSVSGDLGSYTLTVGTDIPDATGEPAQIGDFQLAVTFNAAVSEDARNAILPTGRYTMGNGTEEGTFNVQKTAIYLRTEEGDNGVDALPVIAGTFDVSYKQGDYTIKCSLMTLQGDAYDLIYTGPIGFDPGIGESSPFENDIDITLEGAQMRFYGNWYGPFADDLCLQFYTGTFDDNTGIQTEGYWFNIDLNIPRVSDPWSKNITVPDGVYNVEWREEAEHYTWLPYTFIPGRVIDVFGIMSPIHTYITYKAQSGAMSLGTVTEGTITVSGNGTKFDFDLVMGNGKKLTGKYSGKVPCFNFHDADAPEMEALDHDVTLDFIPSTVAISYNEGQTIVEGLNSYLVMVEDMNEENGDYISFTLLTDQERLPDGTYEIGKFTNFGGLKGYMTYGGGIIYSWYADLSSADEEGYQSILAPIQSGTVKISTVSSTERKFDFDLVTQKGKTIKGSFQGLYMDYADLEEPTQAKIRTRK